LHEHFTEVNATLSRAAVFIMQPSESSDVCKF